MGVRVLKTHETRTTISKVAYEDSPESSSLHSSCIVVLEETVAQRSCKSRTLRHSGKIVWKKLPQQQVKFLWTSVWMTNTKHLVSESKLPSYWTGGSQVSLDVMPHTHAPIITAVRYDEFPPAELRF